MEELCAKSVSLSPITTSAKLIRGSLFALASTSTNNRHRQCPLRPLVQPKSGLVYLSDLPPSQSRSREFKATPLWPSANQSPLVGSSPPPGTPLIPANSCGPSSAGRPSKASAARTPLGPFDQSALSHN